MDYNCLLQDSLRLREVILIEFKKNKIRNKNNQIAYFNSYKRLLNMMEIVNIEIKEREKLIEEQSNGKRRYRFKVFYQPKLKIDTIVSSNSSLDENTLHEYNNDENEFKNQYIQRIFKKVKFDDIKSLSSTNVPLSFKDNKQENDHLVNNDLSVPDFLNDKKSYSKTFQHFIDKIYNNRDSHVSNSEISSLVDSTMAVKSTSCYQKNENLKEQKKQSKKLSINKNNIKENFEFLGKKMEMLKNDIIVFKSIHSSQESVKSSETSLQNDNKINLEMEKEKTVLPKDTIRLDSDNQKSIASKDSEILNTLNLNLKEEFIVNDNNSINKLKIIAKEEKIKLSIQINTLKKKNKVKKEVKSKILLYNLNSNNECRKNVCKKEDLLLMKLTKLDNHSKNNNYINLSPNTINSTQSTESSEQSNYNNSYNKINDTLYYPLISNRENKDDQYLKFFESPYDNNWINWNVNKAEEDSNFSQYFEEKSLFKINDEFKKEKCFSKGDEDLSKQNRRLEKLNEIANKNNSSKLDHKKRNLRKDLNSITNLNFHEENDPINHLTEKNYNQNFDFCNEEMSSDCTRKNKDMLFAMNDLGMDTIDFLE